jgi:signal transduction histidine kinase
VAGTGIAGGVSAVGGAWGALLLARPGLPALDPLVGAFGWAWVPGTVALFTIVPWLARDRALGPAARAGVLLGAAVTLWLTGTRALAPMADARAPIAAVVVAGIVTAGATWWRSRHGPVDERRGLGVLAGATAVMALSFVPLVLTDPGPALFLLVPVSHLVCQALFPAALLVSVLRNRLWGLDLAVSRATVAALATLVLAAGYAGVAAGVSLLVGGSGWAQVAAAAGVVLAVQPVRTWLRGRVHRLVYGEIDPAGAALRVGRTLADGAGQTTDPDDLLDDLAAAVGRSLRLESVTLRLLDTETAGHAASSARETASPPGSAGVVAGGAGTWGAATSPALHVAVRRGDRVIGDLAVTAPPGERLDARSRDGLDQVLPVVAAGLALAAGARDLADARDAALRARLAERRVVRRELHDGLGPWLSGVRLGIQGAINRLDEDPAGARAVLEALHAEAGRRAEDVRDLARSLLPPVLDEQGLDAALDDLVRRLAAEGFTVQRSGDAPGDLDPAVAAAAYGVLSEAARNARRHSGAAGCRLVLRRTATTLEVLCEDRGRGPEGTAGVGTRAMRERVEEIGGVFRIDRAVPADPEAPGTRVQAVLPLRPVLTATAPRPVARGTDAGRAAAR